MCKSLLAAVLLLATEFALIIVAAPTGPHWRHLSSAQGDLPSPGPSDQQTGSLVCDIDNDGVNDFFIVARVVGPAATWFRKTAGGWRKSIVEPDFLRIEASGAFPDIDNDGDSDIVFGADAGGNHIWWWGNPYPNFAPASDGRATSSDPRAPRSITIRSSETSTPTAKPGSSPGTSRPNRCCFAK